MRVDHAAGIEVRPAPDPFHKELPRHDPAVLFYEQEEYLEFLRGELQGFA